MRPKSLVLLGLLIASVVTTVNADNMLRMRFGALWPRKLLETEKPTAWDVGIEYGFIADEKIGVGAGIDLLWNRTVDEKIGLMLINARPMGLNQPNKSKTSHDGALDEEHYVVHRPGYGADVPGSTEIIEEGHIRNLIIR